MPTEQCRRLHYDQSPSPIEEMTELDQSNTGRVVGSSGCDLTFLILRQLFAQKEIFSYEGRCGPQTQNEKAQGIEQKYQ